MKKISIILLLSLSLVPFAFQASAAKTKVNQKHNTCTIIPGMDRWICKGTIYNLSDNMLMVKGIEGDRQTVFFQLEVAPGKSIAYSMIVSMSKYNNIRYMYFYKDGAADPICSYSFTTYNSDRIEVKRIDEYQTSVCTYNDITSDFTLSR